jgi:hypothetical protein
VYPDEEVLMEVGRISIAAGRLDAALGALWWELGPDLVDETNARRAHAGQARDKIRRLARERLEVAHRDALLAFIDAVQSAQEARNEVLHASWLLRGPDATRPVAEFLQLDPACRPDYLTEWEREAVASDGWLRQPHDSTDLVDPHHLDELKEVERQLAAAEAVAVHWRFRIASMREAGRPPGWLGPPEARRGPQPLPPGALTGPAADEALRRLLDWRS